ncbi:MAG TPA: hypothetical protein VFK05_25740 [Polyangiaceae bacterium]|nr:hypothetical protein [Polyangiaceae bacterium]
MKELSSNRRSLALVTRRHRFCFAGCLLLAACGSSSDPGAHPSGGAPNAAAGTGNGSGGSVQPSGGSNAAGGAGPSAGAPSAGDGGGGMGQAGAASGASGAFGASGASGQAGAGPVANVSITPHAIALSAGKAFNVADDFFNDSFIPPSPLANFGFQTPIIPVVRADGSLDVAWLDYTNGKSQPFALNARGMIYITHIEPGLDTGTTVATGISSYRLLGFTSDPSGAFYLAYCADHPLKNDTADDPNNVSGNELKVAKSTSADFTSKVWDSVVFGDQDNSKDQSKGWPGLGGSGVLGFDVTNQKLVLYVAHQMMWTDPAPATIHQAGYFGYFDPATGMQAKPGGNNAAQTGAGWFYSHNFDQRLLIDKGVSYTLAHGDAYPGRQLGFSAYTLDSYTKKNNTSFDQSYFKIAGAEGDNKTDTETGQFIKLDDGRFVIIHTSAQGRTARDVRILLANGTTGAMIAGSEAWLTMNTGNIQATMPKVELLGDKLFVSYGLWDSTQRTNKKIDWYSLLVDLTLKPLGSAKAVTGIEFVKSAPLFRFTAGPSAGSVGWVSGNSMHTLSVTVASAAP